MFGLVEYCFDCLSDVVYVGYVVDVGDDVVCIVDWQNWCGFGVIFGYVCVYGFFVVVGMMFEFVFVVFVVGVFLLGLFEVVMIVFVVVGVGEVVGDVFDQCVFVYFEFDDVVEFVVVF